MSEAGLDLASARILVSNDDGINAPGLKLLAKIARSLCPEVWVVAPEREQSGASHSLTLDRPLRVRRLSTRRYAVDGTPTDCVLLAVKILMRDKRPTLMLSGVNAGANLGEDVTYSGTVAAAMEATLLEVPAIAFSQHYAERRKIPWATAGAHAPEVIRRLTGRPYYWIGPMREEWPDIPGTDLHAVTTGKVSITPICLDLTNGPALAELKKVFP